MVELVHGLKATRVRANLEHARAEIAAAGRDPASVEILAAVKYVPAEELGELAERRGLPQLSIGTSQDYLVAVQEGATIVRLGTSLYS